MSPANGKDKPVSVGPHQDRTELRSCPIQNINSQSTSQAGTDRNVAMFPACLVIYKTQPDFPESSAMFQARNYEMLS